MTRSVETPLNYERAEHPCGCGNPWVLKLWGRWECGNGHALPKPPPERPRMEFGRGLRSQGPWVDPGTDDTIDLKHSPEALLDRLWAAIRRMCGRGSR